MSQKLIFGVAKSYRFISCTHSDRIPKYALTKRLFLLALFIIVLFPGCISVFYTPNAQNAPLFTEKGEVNVSGGFQISSYSTGVDIQLAGAVTDYLGIIANYNHWGGSWETSDPFGGETIYGKHKSNFGEIGLGYYLPFNKKFVFETYGGFGLGKVMNEYQKDAKSTVNYNRFFIQPAIGWHEKNIQLILSTRFCGLDYRQINISVNLNNYNLNEIFYLENHPFSFLIEPAFTFRGGGKYVKFQAQVGFSFNINNPDLMYDPINLNLGLIFTIPSERSR